MKLLIQEPPLQVLPSLASRIGLNEAIVLQQLHYLTLREKGPPERTLKQLREGDDRFDGCFPFWDERTIQRATKRLRDLELLAVEQPKGRHRVNRYTIDYDAVERLLDDDSPSHSMTTDCRDATRQPDAVQDDTSTSSTTTDRRDVLDVVTTEETATTEPSVTPSTSANAEVEVTEGSGGGVSPDGERAQVQVDRWAVRESALKDKRRETARFALPLLRDLAEEHRWGRAETAAEPTLEGVLAVLDQHPTRHHMEALRDLEFYLSHGSGRNKPVRSMEALLLRFVADAQVVNNALTPPAPEPDTDWAVWVRSELPDFPPDSDHFAAAVIQASWAAIANVQPTADAVRAIVERRYGPHRAAA